MSDTRDTILCATDFSPASEHALAWAAALVGMLLLRRTREVLTFITWARLALTLAGRVASILRLLTQPRADSPGR